MFSAVISLEIVWSPDVVKTPTCSCPPRILRTMSDSSPWMPPPKIVSVIPPPEAFFHLASISWMRCYQGASKRVSTSRVSIPGLMILRATILICGSRCSAR